MAEEPELITAPASIVIDTLPVLLLDAVIPNMSLATIVPAWLLTVTSPGPKLIRPDTVAARSVDVRKIVDGHVAERCGVRRICRASLVSRQNSGRSGAAAGVCRAGIDCAVGRDRNETVGQSAYLRDRCRLVVDVDADAAGVDRIAGSGSDGDVSSAVRERLDAVEKASRDSRVRTGGNGDVPVAVRLRADAIAAAADISGLTDGNVAVVCRIQILGKDAAESCPVPVTFPDPLTRMLPTPVALCWTEIPWPAWPMTGPDVVMVIEPDAF